MAAYALFFNITCAMVSMILGFYTYSRNVINYFIANKRTIQAKKLFERFYWIYLKINSLIMIVTCLAMLAICKFEVISDPALRYWVIVSTPFTFLIGVTILQICFTNKAFIWIGFTCYQIAFQVFELVRLPSTYYFCITLKMGLFAVMGTDLVFALIKMILFSLWAFFQADWSKAEIV